MRKFDQRYRGKVKESGSRYAVFDRTGNPYPPKWIVSLATQVPRNRFSGGTRINGILSELGFHVDRAPDVIRNNRWPHKRPSITRLLARLFSGKWRQLTGDLIREDTPNDPGVYLVAFPPTNRDLAGKAVRNQEICYIGMSNHAGVKKRLKQFLSSAEGRPGHSGGTRFFGLHGRYNPDKRPIFVTWLSIRCETRKEHRTAQDLLIMGAVADLEQCALARVKQALHCEPDLNAQ